MIGHAFFQRRGIYALFAKVRCADIEDAKRICLKHPDLNAEALVGCSFDSLFKARCGEVRKDSAALDQALAPFAFIPNLAGALLAVELLRANASLMETNFMSVSPWAPSHGRSRRYASKDESCEFCMNEDAQAFLRSCWPELFGEENKNVGVA